MHEDYDDLFYGFLPHPIDTQQIYGIILFYRPTGTTLTLQFKNKVGDVLYYAADEWYALAESEYPGWTIQQYLNSPADVYDIQAPTYEGPENG